MFLGYNTNGFAHHRLADAIAILADLGYRGIALTLDVHHLDPFAADATARAAGLREQLDRLGMKCVIETGSRFLLDPRRKHQPTLISPTPAERETRLDFLQTCIDIAALLDAPCVSFWSGSSTEAISREALMQRLVEGCKRLADYAAARSVRLAFEPEPGMLIDTMDAFNELFEAVSHPAFGLTLDIGHLLCTGELPASRYLEAWKAALLNVHLEDMRRRVHDHLMFGEGDVDFDDVFEGLRAAEYKGGVYVELSRHSYDAVQTAAKAMAFLRPYMEKK